MSDPTAALSEQLHRQFGCRITCRGGRLADDGHPSHGEAWSDTAAAIIAALDAAGWTLITHPSPGESSGYDRELDLVRRLAAAEYQRDTIDARLRKIEEVAIDISRRTYVDEGVVAHVPFATLYALRQALYGSDDEIIEALEKLERQ